MEKKQLKKKLNKLIEDTTVGVATLCWGTISIKETKSLLYFSIWKFENWKWKEYRKEPDYIGSPTIVTQICIQIYQRNLSQIEGHLLTKKKNNIKCLIMTSNNSKIIIMISLK